MTDYSSALRTFDGLLKTDSGLSATRDDMLRRALLVLKHLTNVSSAAAVTLCARGGHEGLNDAEQASLSELAHYCSDHAFAITQSLLDSPLAASFRADLAVQYLQRELPAARPLLWRSTRQLDCHESDRPETLWESPAAATTSA